MAKAPYEQAIEVHTHKVSVDNIRTGSRAEASTASNLSYEYVTPQED